MFAYTRIDFNYTLLKVFISKMHWLIKVDIAHYNFIIVNL